MPILPTSNPKRIYWVPDPPVAGDLGPYLRICRIGSISLACPGTSPSQAGFLHLPGYYTKQVYIRFHTPVVFVRVQF